MAKRAHLVGAVEVLLDGHGEVILSTNRIAFDAAEGVTESSDVAEGVISGWCGQEGVYFVGEGG